MRRYKKLGDQFLNELNMEQIFNAFSADKHCFFLDSSLESESLGRFSFIGSEPAEVFEFTKGMEKPFMELRKLLHDVKALNEKALNEKAQYEKSVQNEEIQFPFDGGFVGYLSYDLGRYIEALPEKAAEDVEIPYYWFGKYNSILAIDHQKKEAWILLHGDSVEDLELEEETLKKKLEQAIKNTEKELHGEPLMENKPTDKQRDKFEDKVNSKLSIKGNNDKAAVAKIYMDNSLEERNSALEAEAVGLHSNLTKQNYMKSVERIRDYIRAGDVYQVNMTQRFSMKVKRKAADIYRELRKRNAAPFAGYLDFSSNERERHILSSSPERLLRFENGFAESRPIKGTLPRGKTLEEDQELALALEKSEKDRSELLMIVDLVRNDLGKVAKPGSVKVPQLFHVEHYATVHHLVASVTCELDHGKDQIDLLEGIFPGGSITGAPKIRAMEIIDELEPTRRNIYTGSMGYIGYNGNMDFNILIRSILKLEEDSYYQVGGGIVWDSDPSAEYDETLHKGKAILKTLTGF